MSYYYTLKDGRRIKFPDDATQEEMDAMISAYGDTTPPPQPEAAPVMMTPEHNPLSQQIDAAKNWAMGNLPALGGIAGGIAGSPGGIPGMILGSGVGGAALEGIRERAQGEDLSAPKIATEGGKQALYEVLGQGLGKVVGGASSALMRNALKVGKTPESKLAVSAMKKQALTVSEKDALKSHKLMRESAGKLSAILKKETAGGRVAKTSDVITDIKKTLRNPGLETAKRNRLLLRLRAWVSQYGSEIDPVTLKKIKQEMQAEAEPVTKAIRSGKSIPSAAQRRSARFSGAIASGAKRELEKIPGVAAQEANTSGLIAAEAAIKKRLAMRPGTFEINKPATWPVVGLIDNPKIDSQVAVWLSRPWAMKLAQQSPRLAAAIFIGGSAEPDATDQ